ncbi:Proline-serine-threonine phosphatase-interacting protein 2 [Manis javanica]|nr:Proline-serine-threonine phosphatase-interacting protein 2 [Manis javanica]
MSKGLGAVREHGKKTLKGNNYLDNSTMCHLQLEDNLRDGEWKLKEDKKFVPVFTSSKRPKLCDQKSRENVKTLPPCE